MVPRHITSSVIFLFSILFCAFFLNAQIEKHWTGSVSENWTHPENWSPQGIPDSIDNVFIPPSIPNYPAMPVLDSSFVIHNLTIESTGYLTLNGYRLEVCGDFLADSAGSVYRHLRMQNSADSLIIDGNAVFKGANSLDTGTVILTGDLTQRDQSISLQAFGTKFIFSGDSAQTITFENPGADTLFTSFLGDVNFDNPAGVIFNSDVFIRGQMLLSENCFVEQSADYGTHFIKELPRLKSDSYLIPNSSVDGDIILDRDVVFPQPINNLNVTHKLQLNGNKLSVGADFTAEASGSVYLHLQMLMPQDTLVVLGDASFLGSNSLEAGTVILKGNFSQHTEQSAVEPIAVQFIFSGDTTQTIYFEHPGQYAPFYSYFRDVRIDSQAEVLLRSDVYCLGNFDNFGTLKIPSGIALHGLGARMHNKLNGYIAGGGVISSDTTRLFNDGFIKPGLELFPDTLRIDTDFQQSEYGHLDLFIYPQDDSLFPDHLEIHGEAQLAGGLNVTFTDTSGVQIGDSIRIISYESRNGEFVEMPALPPFEFEVSYKEDGIDIIIADTISTEISPEDDVFTVPATLILLANYPNPFNPETTIRYGLPADSPIRVTIYDIQGRQVWQYSNAMSSAGWHTVRWDGRDAHGALVSTGVYLYRLKSGTFTAVKKMILMR